MKKLFSITLMLTILFSNCAFAEKKKTDNSTIKVKIGMLESYAPFMWRVFDRQTESLLHEELNEALLKNNFKVEYIIRDNIDELVLKLESGDIDVLLINYFEEKLEKKFDYIYPAYIKNPLVLVTLPNNVKNVKTLEDLKKYSGVVKEDEPFTTYVNDKITAYNIKKAKNGYEAFDMLFSGDTDFILTSKYVAMVDVMKYGLKNRVTMSNQSLYQMPMFVTVSKVSVFRKKLKGIITKMLMDKSNYKNDLVQNLKYFQKKYKGAVPPNFTDPEDKVTDELTPEEIAAIKKAEAEKQKKIKKEELIKKNELDKATKEMDRFFR